METEETEQVEEKVEEAIKKEQQPRISWFAWGCALLVVAILAAIFFPVPVGTRHAALESRATGTLRSLGSSQLSYQGTNNMGVYGSFQALLDDMYIGQGYTMDNIIEDYSLTWDIVNLSVVTDDGITKKINEFEIIAWPESSVHRKLRTFAITEDQTVRVFNPKEGNRLEDVKSWDPIL